MGKTILLVDEEEGIASLLTSMLEGKGHRVVRAKGGREALDFVHQEQPDLAIVGEQLEDIDGIGWIVKLRSVSRTLKVIFISKEWRDAQLYKLLTKDYGVALVVHRPLKPLLFAAQVESQLGSSSMALAGSDLEEKALTAMRSRFMDSLNQRLSTISRAIENARTRPDDVSLSQEARRLVHNLKGTSSSCGFGGVAEVSSLLEKHLIAIQAPERAFDQQAWIEIEELFVTVNSRAQVELEDKKNGAAIAAGADDSAMAKVLFVGTDELTPDGDNSLNNGLSVKVIASTPSEAMDKAYRNALDAVLIDLDSDAQPVKLARELRGMSGYESLPVGFIAPADRPADPVETAHAGASLFLGKPVVAEELRNGIEYLLAVRQGGRPRILVVDDDEEFCALIAGTLGKEGMLVRCLYDPSTILAVMESFIPDLVLLDVLMPVVSGFDVCRMLRGTPRWQDTPILFLTAQTELEARLAAFDAGGDDYLPKPVAPIELLTRVKVRLERARLIRERADKDALTGLLLRRAFTEQISGVTAEAERHDFMYTIALIDVDKFKAINDTYGHLAGDRVLAYFGQLLKRRFRVEDIRGRWGGEEFIVALRHEEKPTTKGALARVLEELRKVEFPGDHGEVFSVTFTAGLASFPEDGDTLEKLVRVADGRLYKGKEAGRNRIVSVD